MKKTSFYCRQNANGSSTKLFPLLLSFIFTLSCQFSFAQRGLEIAQGVVDNFSYRNKINASKTQKPENISDQISMVSEALKYRIDSIIESDKFDINVPFTPVRAYAYSFDGWGNDMRVTEERMYEYNPGPNDFSGQRTRRLMTYNNSRQLTSERLEEFSSGTWNELDRVEITYNAQGHLAVVKEFFNNSFDFGDSLAYTYDSDNLITSVDLFSKFGSTSNWELQLRVSSITYINRKEASVVLDLDAMGTGTVAPFFRFMDLEWDAGYYPILDGILSYIRQSYTPRMFGQTELGLPSNARLQINFFVWSDFQKFGTLSQSGNTFEMYEATSAGAPGSPLTDTVFYHLSLNSNNVGFYLMAEEPSNTGVGRDPIGKDSIGFDSEGNEVLYLSQFYDDIAQQFETSYMEHRDISYSGTNSISQIDLTIDDGF